MIYSGLLQDFKISMSRSYFIGLIGDTGLMEQAGVIDGCFIPKTTRTDFMYGGTKKEKDFFFSFTNKYPCLEAEMFKREKKGRNGDNLWLRKHKPSHIKEAF